MSEITFDGTDGIDTSAQEQAQARALEVGEKLIAEQEAATLDNYQRARADEESQLRFAGKFKSAEDLEKAYKELERKLGEKSSEPEGDDEPAAESEETESTPEEADEGGEESTTADLLTKATEEFYSEDGLSEETLKTLKQLPAEDLVDAYIELQKNATAPEPIGEAEAIKLITEVAGSQEAYNQALEWAAENLSPQEVASYDAVISSGNVDAIRLAIQALSLRAKFEGGFEGTPVSGKAVKNQGTKGFRSQAELATAIGDPRYRNDPAYRLEVQARLANSGDLL